MASAELWLPAEYLPVLAAWDSRPAERPRRAGAAATVFGAAEAQRQLAFAGTVVGCGGCSAGCVFVVIRMAARRMTGGFAAGVH